MFGLSPLAVVGVIVLVSALVVIFSACILSGRYDEANKAYEAEYKRAKEEGREQVH